MRFLQSVRCAGCMKFHFNPEKDIIMTTLESIEPITRAIPEIVKARGIGAIREWLGTSSPWIEAYGVSYHGYKAKAGRLNVVGFWARQPGSDWQNRFRPLKTLRPGETL